MADIHHIGDLFAVYKKRFRAPQKTVEQTTSVVIADVMGIQIGVEKIHYTVASRTITIQASSMIKSEVKAREAAILDALRVQLGPSGAPEIIF